MMKKSEWKRIQCYILSDHDEPKSRFYLFEHPTAVRLMSNAKGPGYAALTVITALLTERTKKDGPERYRAIFIRGTYRFDRVFYMAVLDDCTEPWDASQAYIILSTLIPLVPLDVREQLHQLALDYSHLPENLSDALNAENDVDGLFMTEYHRIFRELDILGFIIPDGLNYPRD
jgi:hypothetical protein